MQDLTKAHSLSSGDALFLYFERQGQPVNVAAVTIFEGKIPLDGCRNFIESRLPLIPRYLERVVTAPYNIDLPTWERDPKFDIRNHVRGMTLKNGTEEELKEAAGKILSTSLDRRRPLWDFTLLHGLQGNRTGAVIRMHHCLADGIAGIGLMHALMDPSPAPLESTKEQLPPPLSQNGQKSLIDDLITSSMATVKRILAAESELLTLARQAVAGPEKSADAGAAREAYDKSEIPFSLLDELTRMLTELGTPPERLPFNVVCRGPQKFNWAEIPLAEIKAVKNACGATVNDVVLAAVTSTVRRYAELHKVHAKGRRLRIVIPVNVREKGKAGDFGNRITFFPVDIPLDLDDPRKLVDAVHTAVARIRGAHLPELISLLGSWIGAIPTALQAILAPVASQLPLSLCNLICTNVPGPQVPLYFFGHRLLACYPYVPIGGEMGMNCAVLSYDGTVYFGFSGDAQAIADLKVLDKMLAASFAEMRRAIGVCAAHRPRPKPEDVRKKITAARTKKAVRATASARQPMETASAPAVMPPPLQTVVSEAILHPGKQNTGLPETPVSIPARPEEQAPETKAAATATGD